MPQIKQFLRDTLICPIILQYGENLGFSSVFGPSGMAISINVDVGLSLERRISVELGIAKSNNDSAFVQPQI